MKTAAKVIIIAGLVLGSLGGLFRVALLFTGEGMLETIGKSADQTDPNFLIAKQGLEQASAKTALNIGSIAGSIVLILAGGILGLLAAASDMEKKAKLVFTIITIVAGIGLLVLQSYISAGAYIIGGFLLLVYSDKEAAH